MSNISTTTVILAIPGGQETREISIEAAHAAIARGEIEPHHWAWSPHHNDWKQVSELPELQLPTVSAKPAPAELPQPRQTTVHVSPAVAKKKTAANHVVKEEEGFSYFKFFVVALLVAILAIVGANYALVDQPLRLNLTQTTFPAVPVHGHLGAFLQPDALVIHLLPDKTVNADNLADFLVALAGSTPHPVLGQTSFTTVGLTRSWTSQYLISGTDWLALGQLVKSSEDEKRKFILTHFSNLTGEPLLVEKKNEDPDAAAQVRAKAWQSLASSLTTP